MIRTLVLLTLAGLAACAPAEPRVVVDSVWSRPTAAEPGAEVDEHAHHDQGDHDSGGAAPAPGVVYMTLSNEGGAADRLLGVRSDICASAELHETKVDNDRMQMRPVSDGIEVPAGGRVELRPGGYHVMLLGLEQELHVGQRFSLTLQLEHGGEVVVESEVLPPTATHGGAG